MKKFLSGYPRAYYHLIKRLQKHREHFGVHPIRAVLIETTDEARGRKLMELVRQPVVIGNSKRSALFCSASLPYLPPSQVETIANPAPVTWCVLN
ncbi:MAG: hypothetical protein DMG14_16875 [Acidobacteria bacterium]|nr:MAG: hypothetical protein DMG14_16875 [Acidobacteriota bacterium]PYS50176.1 MAG: hypothetical protein DMG13_21655 [Acidobacteriota bacterium]